MTLEDVWRTIRTHWVLLVAFTLVGTAAAAGYWRWREPVYTATAVAYVVPQDGSAGGGRSSEGPPSAVAMAKARSWVPLATSVDTARETVRALGLDLQPDQLAARVSAEHVRDTPTISVSVTGSTPREAQRLADGVVQAMRGQARRLDGASSGVDIEPIQNAHLPTHPTEPHPEWILPIGALLGLLLGLLVALVRRRRAGRVRDQSDVERHIGTSVLSVLPASKDLEARDRVPRGAGSHTTRDALQQLRTNLTFVNVDHAPRTVVVTAARAGEGSSTVAANLARTMADAGQRVVLIDADLREPAVADIFQLDARVGLTQVLAGSVALTDAVQEGDRANLRVLTAGHLPPNPSGLLSSARMHHLLLTLGRDAMVVLDSPPLLEHRDAALLSASADGALLVISAAGAREPTLSRAVAAINRVGGQLLGAVLTQVSGKQFKRIVAADTRFGYGTDLSRREPDESDEPPPRHARGAIFDEAATDIPDQSGAEIERRTAPGEGERSAYRRRPKHVSS